MPTTEKFWTGEVSRTDDFGGEIKDEFVDGRVMGVSSWAIMNPLSFRMYGVGLGTGKGQRYKKQKNGRWLKIEG